MSKAHRNIWDIRAMFRRKISLSNRNILVIEKVQEVYGVNAAEAMEMLIGREDIYLEMIDKLSEDYHDIRVLA